MAETAVPAWKLHVHKARAALTLLAILLEALVLEFWQRVVILPRLKAGVGDAVDVYNRVIRFWGKSTLLICRIGLGLKVSVEGTPPDSGRFLLISNHQSSLDIPALMSILPALNLKFVAKEELKYGAPAVSLALRNGGFVFVAKRNRKEDLELLRRFGKDVAGFKGSPAIFTEGIRTFDGNIRPFHFAGTEAVLSTARLPILPVTIDGLWMARTIKEYHLLVGSRVTFRIGEQVPYEVYLKDPKEVLQGVEEGIKANLVDIRQAGS